MLHHEGAAITAGRVSGFGRCGLWVGGLTLRSCPGETPIMEAFGGFGGSWFVVSADAWAHIM